MITNTSTSTSTYTNKKENRHSRRCQRQHQLQLQHQTHDAPPDVESAASSGWDALIVANHDHLKEVPEGTISGPNDMQEQGPK